MPNYDSYFQDAFLGEEIFKIWLKKDEKDISNGFCRVCYKSFIIGKRGIDNVRQHIQGKKHIAKYSVPGKIISFVDITVRPYFK